HLKEIRVQLYFFHRIELFDASVYFSTSLIRWRFQLEAECVAVLSAAVPLPGAEHSEHRDGCRNLLELRKRRVLVYPYVRARSRCSLEVSLQDGCPLASGYFFEANLLPAAVPENRLSTGCAYVMNPLHVISEH